MISKEAFKETKQIILNNAKKGFIKDFVILDNDLNIIKKDLEVLEIIKTKCLTNCNLALVKNNLHYHKYCKGFEYFLNKWNTSPNGFEITKEDLITQEEFYLLREWLNDK